MRVFKRSGTARRWARLAMKCGLLLTDAKMWSSIGEQLRDRADQAGDEVKRRYDDEADRLQEAGRALRGRSHWAARTMNFLGGIGIGMGLGMLFAPVSGQEARTAIRDKVVDIKKKVGGMAADGTIPHSSTISPATGTGN
jgi:hypothetical protein